MFRNTFSSDVDVTSARLVRGGVLVGSSMGVCYHRTLPAFSAASTAAPTVYQLHVPAASSSSSTSCAAVTQYEGIAGTTTTAMAAKAALSHVVGGTDNGSVRVWDGATAAQVRTFANCHRAAVTAVEYHPFGEFLATGSRDTHVRVWDFRKKSCLQAYKTAGAGAVEALRFSPDGRWVASGDANGTVRIFDLVKGELMKELSMAAVGGGASSGATGSAGSGSAISTIVSSLAFHPLRCEIAVASAGGSLSVWDCLTFQPLFTTAQPGCTVAGFVNAACLAFTGSHSRHVHVYAQGGSHHEVLERVAPAASTSSLESAFQLRDLRGGSLGESSATADASVPAAVDGIGADPAHALVSLSRPLLQLAYTTGRSVVLTQLAVPARFSDGNGAVAASRPTSRTASRPPSSAAAAGVTPRTPAAAAVSPLPSSPVPLGAPQCATGGTSPLPAPAAAGGGILHGRRSGQSSSAAAGIALDRPSSAQPSPIPGGDPLQHPPSSRAQTADAGAVRPHLAGHVASSGSAGDLSGRGIAGGAARLVSGAPGGGGSGAHHQQNHLAHAGSNSSTPTSLTPATTPASVVAAGPGAHMPVPKNSPPPAAAVAAGRPPTPPPAPIVAAVSPLPPPTFAAAAAATPDDDDAALLAQTIGRSDTMVHRMMRRQSDLAIFRSLWPQQPDRAFAHLEQVILETKDCAVAVSFLSNLHRPRIKGQVSWEHAPALLGIVATILQSYGVDAFLIAAIKAARHLNQRFRVRLEEGARGINGPTPGRIPPVGAVEKCRLGLSRLAEIQPIVAELCLKSGVLGIEAKSLIADLPVPGAAAAFGSGGSMGF